MIVGEIIYEKGILLNNLDLKYVYTMYTDTNILN
jgi:hypothetical protein